jgi:hypothetical protein
MEELIRLKIAELEENYPQQALENRLINDIMLQENEIQFDESEICRPFDSEVLQMLMVNAYLLFLHTSHRLLMKEKLWLKESELFVIYIFKKSELLKP